MGEYQDGEKENQELEIERQDVGKRGKISKRYDHLFIPC